MGIKELIIKLMKTIRQYLALAILLAIGSEYANASTLITIVNSNKVRPDETRKVSGFSGISSSGSYHVFITMGNAESLRLEGDADVIREIETEVENGILKIRNKKQLSGWNRTSGGKVNIYIYAKSLSSITLSGSGDIEVKGLVKAPNLSNTISGSGSISLNMDAENYTATISGSGEIRAKGNADNAKITVSGSGDFEGNNLRISNASAKVSGSGDISLAADKNLEAVMSGSGNIRYSGNANVKSTKSGSGNISKL